MPDTSQSRRPYLAIVAIALVLRIAWACLVPIAPISDSHAYDVCAKNLAAVNTFGFEVQTPWAYWPVGTSFAYSLVYRVFGAGSYAPVAALNGLLGAAMVALAMAAAKRWFGRRPALVTGLILALWPTHIFFTTIIASETLFTALCLAGLIAWPRTPSAQRLVLAGLLFAAATYVRPTAMLIPAVLAAAEWLRSPGRESLRFALTSAAVTLFVMGLCIAPWAARNQRLFGRVVLISTNSGSNLWMGNNPESTGAYQDPPSPAGLNEAERDAYRGRLAREYIVQNPGAFLARTLFKAARLHATETIGVGWNIEGLKEAAPGLVPDERAPAIRVLKLLSTGYWLAALLLSLPGVFILAARNGMWRMLLCPPVLIWAYFTAVHAVIVIQDRYHLPATPFIASLAAVAIAAFLDRRSAQPA